MIFSCVDSQVKKKHVPSITGRLEVVKLNVIVMVLVAQDDANDVWDYL